MAISQDVARQRFAQFVKRALRQARDRGMNDLAIHKATGVTPTTFHRWQRGEGTQLPTLEKVRAFCAGLDIPVAPALAALGINDTREATPEPPLDPDLRRLAHILADPNVSDADKMYIRRTLQMLIGAYGRKAGERATT